MKLDMVLFWFSVLILAYVEAAAIHVKRTFPVSVGKSAANVPTPNDLTKRTAYPPISQDAWNEAVNEGCNLLGAAGSKDELAVTFFQGRIGTIQSEFLNYPQDFQDWGYTWNGGDVADYRMGAGPDLYRTYQELGIDTRRDDEGGTNVPVAWKHTQQTTHDNVNYPATGAVFSSIINVDYGVLVGWHKFSPAFMASTHIPPITPLPKLRSWGEVVFLDWLNVAHRRNWNLVSNLRYVISADVTNTETGQILQRMLQTNDIKHNCRRWYRWSRRVEFSMETEEGQAILSSPNGRGAALLLIQHKNYFGQRTTIEKVSVWCAYTDSWEIHLMFHVLKQPDGDSQAEMAGSGANDTLATFEEDDATTQKHLL